jgi:Icc-related predicted phosphoesterase
MEPLGIMNLHLQTWEYQGLTFGGFEGSPRYKKDPYAKMYTEEEAAQLLKNFSYVDVLISHSPPRGINDEDDLAHTGFQALRTYIEEKHPRYFLHGHTHPKVDELATKHHETQIIYINGDQLITLL